MSKTNIPNKIYVHDSEFWSNDEFLDEEKGEEYISKDFIESVFAARRKELGEFAEKFGITSMRSSKCYQTIVELDLILTKIRNERRSI